MSPLKTALRTASLLCLLAPVLAWAGAAETHTLTNATYTRWRDYLAGGQERPEKGAIPWRASLWEAVVEAQTREEPILLWTMNGHPLACT